MKLEKLTPGQLKRVKIAGFATLAIVSALAYASPVESFYYEYYSDATYTEQVGERSFSCGAMGYHWGIETAYRIGGTQKC